MGEDPAEGEGQARAEGGGRRRVLVREDRGQGGRGPWGQGAGWAWSMGTGVGWVWSVGTGDGVGVVSGVHASRNNTNLIIRTAKFQSNL